MHIYSIAVSSIACSQSVAINSLTPGFCFSCCLILSTQKCCFIANENFIYWMYCQGNTHARFQVIDQDNVKKSDTLAYVKVVYVKLSLHVEACLLQSLWRKWEVPYCEPISAFLNRKRLPCIPEKQVTILTSRRKFQVSGSQVPGHQRVTATGVLSQPSASLSF